MTAGDEWANWLRAPVAGVPRSVALAAVLFAVVRSLVGMTSGFGTYHGWNEGWYAMMALGLLENPLVPRYVGEPVFNVTPLFTYLVAGTFAILGPAPITARLPSILGAAVAIVATYHLGRALYSERTARLGAVLMAVVPMFALYGGRTQTDMVMLALLTAASAAIVQGYRGDVDRRLVLGGALWAVAVAAKQPAVLLPAVVAGWLATTRGIDALWSRSTGLVVASGVVGLVPLAGWYGLNLALAPGAVTTDLVHELLGRTAPFSNLPLLAIVGFGLGLTPPILFLAGLETWSSLRTRLTDDRSFLVWWLAIFGGFVLYRTPSGHQYYALVLVPAVTLLAIAGIGRLVGTVGERRDPQWVRTACVAVVLLSAIGATAVFFDVSGEFSPSERSGEQVTADAAPKLVAHAPPGATVLVVSDVNPQLRWYTRRNIPAEHLVPVDPSSLTTHELRTVRRETDGPVYLVVPVPAWAAVPEVVVPVAETPPYEPTFGPAADAWVPNGTKMAYYLSDRRLRLYRVDLPDAH